MQTGTATRCGMPYQLVIPSETREPALSEVERRKRYTNLDHPAERAANSEWTGGQVCELILRANLG